MFFPYSPETKFLLSGETQKKSDIRNLVNRYEMAASQMNTVMFHLS